MIPSKEEGQAIVDRALSLSRADDVHVTLTATQMSHLRFARNAPSTNGEQSDLVLTIESSFGKKSASTAVNQLDARTLAEAVARSEQLARLAPDDPEHMPGLGPQAYVEVPTSYDERALEAGPAAIVRGTARCIEQARALGMTAAGYSRLNATAAWVGNQRGLRGHQRETNASFSHTVRTASGGGSGWAAGVGDAASQIDYGACSQVAIAKARASVAPRPLAPGKYVTILEPSCVASLIQLFLLGMNARSAEEGRSFFSKPGGKTKVGEQLFPEAVTLRSDPAASVAPGAAFGSEALPQRARTWVDRGRLEALTCDRFWAQKQGREPLPAPSNLLMDGGKGTLEELIADTPRGVLITSLFYIRFVDPRTLLLTGLTRDGVFWIEGGKLSHPVNNFRWNESPARVLSHIDAMTESVRAAPRESMATNVVAPALRVTEFELSSVSDAV
jgi:predicted Zn-dependent protease